MPKELIRIAADIRWYRTVTQAGQFGLKTDIFFEVGSQSFSLVLDTVPEKAFLHTLAHARCLAIYEISSVVCGWVESGRFQIRINDDDDIAEATAMADRVEWSPSNPGSIHAAVEVYKTDNRARDS